MARLIFESSLTRDPSTGSLVSYWPDYWPVDKLLSEWITQGSPFFMASYQNDPSSLEGKVLKVEWLHFYLPGELQAARNQSGGGQGVKKVGIDPTFGGEGSDADFACGVAAEILNGKAYLTDFLHDRVKVTDQGMRFGSWMEGIEPDFVTVEEQASRGYAYTDIVAHTSYPVVSERPKSGMNKTMRLLQMAAHAQNERILAPGVISASGEMVIDPRWARLLQEWRSYPGGHDDFLDAVYWSTFNSFDMVIPAGVTRHPGIPKSVKSRDSDFDDSRDKKNDKREKDEHKAMGLDVRDARGRAIRPIGVRRERVSIRGFGQR